MLILIWINGRSLISIFALYNEKLVYGTKIAKSMGVCDYRVTIGAELLVFIWIG